LTTGDRSVVRDFLDVRDVVRAYDLLLERGRSGEVYNVCSGVGSSIEQVIGTMQELLGTEAELMTDPALLRPNDNRAVVGSHDKLTRELGWRPAFDLKQTLASVVEWSQAQVSVP